MNFFGEFDDIHNAERTIILGNADFTRPWPNRWKGLPVVGFFPVLHLVELIPSISPGLIREGPQVIERGIYEIDVFRIVLGIILGIIHNRIIQNFV